MITTFQFPVVTALLFVAALSLLTPYRRLGIVLSLTWLSSELLVRHLTGGPLWPFGSYEQSPNATLADFAPWKWSVVIYFAASAYLVNPLLRPPPNKATAFIVSIFILQCVWALGFGLAANWDHTIHYLTMQTNLLWLQIFILGSFAGGYGGRYILRRFADMRRAAVAVHREGMAK